MSAMTPASADDVGEFAPRPGRASLGRMVRAQVWMELKLMLRNGEQVLALAAAAGGTRSTGAVPTGATTVAMARPSRQACSVTHRSLRNDPRVNSSPARRRIDEAGGRYSEFTNPARVSASAATSSTATPSAPRRHRWWPGCSAFTAR